jgi:Mg-chelatase subunit ChlD
LKKKKRRKRKEVIMTKKCSVCQKSFTTKASLLQHATMTGHLKSKSSSKAKTKTNKVEGKASFECSTCHAIFTTKPQLKRHLLAKNHFTVSKSTTTKVKKSTNQTTEFSSTKGKKFGNGIFASFLLDSSGSMGSNDKWNGALTGLEDAFKRLDAKKDVVSLNHFNHEMQECFPPMTPGRVKMNQVRKTVKPEGGTALFDSMIGVLESWKQRKACTRDPFLVVVTDGCDEHSSKSRGQVVSAIQSSQIDHLQVILIGVGLSSHGSGWRDLCAIRDACSSMVTLWKVEDTGAKVAEILRRTVCQIVTRKSTKKKSFQFC